jgi:phytoene dehydrogenase-like protein
MSAGAVVTGADALVLGSGVDELVCAHYLARAGHRVQVLEERAPEPDDAPGWIPPRVIRDLELERHGLAIRRPDPWVTAPLPGGGFLQLWADRARSVDAIRRVSQRDAAKWPEFSRRMVELAGLLERVYTDLPRDPVSPAASELARLGGLGNARN